MKIVGCQNWGLGKWTEKQLKNESIKFRLLENALGATNYDEMSFSSSVRNEHDSKCIDTMLCKLLQLTCMH